MLRSAFGLQSLLLLSVLSAPAQTIVWTVDGSQTNRKVLLPNSNEDSNGSPAPVTTPKPVKIDTGTATQVNVTVSPGVAPSGNWLRYASVAPGADCSRAAYNSYPSAFSSVTPVYLCLRGVLTTAPNQGRGYYGAIITFALPAGPTFGLPVELLVSPSGYLQLDSPAGADSAYNDYQFNVGVTNGQADSALTVHAALRDLSGNPLKDSKGNLVVAQVTPVPQDTWVVVTKLANPTATTQAFQISVNPNAIPVNQTALASRVQFNNQGSFQGESSVFVNATATLPTPILSAGANSINLDFPNGQLSTTINPQSSGALITFNASAQSDDGTGWLSVSPVNGDTQNPLLITAAVTSSRAAGTYTGSVVLTPTNIQAQQVTVPVTLHVAASAFRIAGTVSDASGNCSSGVTITLSGGANTTTQTGSNGTYSFSGLTSANYVVTPSKGGCTFTPASMNLNLTGDSLSNNFIGSRAAVTLLFPLNGATSVPANSTLTWAAVSGATSYDVFFGAGNPSFAANVSGTTFTLTGALANVTYSWQINAKNGAAVVASSPTFTFTTGNPPTASGLYFIPVPPCRLVDTRPSQANTGPFGPPIINAGETRTFFPAQGSCPGVPPSAKAYSFNVTVRPTSTLTYLTIWPSGQAVPDVSTLNAFQGGMVSNAAIVPAGSDGGVNVFVTDQTHLQLDINGYFDSVASGAATAFYSLPPCRIANTTNPNGTFGGPRLSASASRDFPAATSGCLPAQANPVAYSLNVTVLPTGPLDFVEVWPANTPQPPSVVTIGSPSGAILADAALVQGSGSTGAVSVFASSPADLILDVNGYFKAAGASGGLLFHALPPCRVVNTRDPTIRPLGGPIMASDSQRTFPITTSPCGVPSGAQAYSLNVTVLPTKVLSFLTLLPTGQARPLVSTLNDFTGIILANAAIVPAGQNGSVDVYVTHESHVLIDINGYFSAQ
jgi:hypothetical protein